MLGYLSGKHKVLSSNSSSTKKKKKKEKPKNIIKKTKPSVGVHICNPSTQEAEAGGS
jgi:hypothetical protein